MGNLLLINGCGGAGKDTTGQLLLTKLKTAALIDIKGVTRVEPWQYGGAIGRLGVQNAASLISNFNSAKYNTIILTGGVENQEKFDLLHSLVPKDLNLYYFWLDVPKSIRDERRIVRQRDEGDNPQHLDQIDSVFTDPGTLCMSTGKYFRITATSLTRRQVAEYILSAIELGSNQY